MNRPLKDTINLLLGVDAGMLLGVVLVEAANPMCDVGLRPELGFVLYVIIFACFIIYEAIRL